MFNGRLGEDCYVVECITTYKTIIYHFITIPLGMHSVLVSKILENDALFSDVHCGLNAQLEFTIKYNMFIADANTQEVRQPGVKPGQLNVEIKSAYERNINLSNVNEVIAKISDNC